VILGAKKPLVELFTCNIALGSGAEPSSLIPTFCAFTVEYCKKIATNKNKRNFLMSESFKCYEIMLKA
jgi:hypothetical protein